MATVAEGCQNQVESITSSDIGAPSIVAENAAQLEPCASNESMNEEQHHSPVKMTTAEESAQSEHMDIADAAVLPSREAMVQQPDGKLLDSVQEMPIGAEHAIFATSPQVEILPTYSGDEHPIGIDSIQQDDESDQMHSHRVSVSGTPRCSLEELMPISQIASDLHCENAVEIALPEVPDSSPLDDIPVDSRLCKAADDTTSPGVVQCGIESQEPTPSVGALSVGVNNNPSEQIDTDADQWKEVHTPKLEVVEKEEHVLQEVRTDEEARTTESDYIHEPVEMSSTSDGPITLQADKPETATNVSKSEMEDSHNNETRNLEELVTADDDCRGKDAPESTSGSAAEAPKAPEEAARSSSAPQVSGGAPSTSAIVTAAPPRRVWRSTHNKCTEETDNDPSWYQHKRHLLVFTYSGKPVFTRYGSEDGLSGTTGALSAIVSKIATLFQGQTDTLRYMVAGDHIFAFLEKGPLWLVCISRCGDTYPDLVRLLERVHSQIIAILTAGVERTLQKNPGYDVRNLLGGTDNVVNNMIRWCTQDLHLQVDGFEPLPLPPAFRTVAIESLRSARIQNVLCGFLMGGHRIISIMSNRQYKVSATDLAMIINMIMSSALKAAESWTPVCLANLNNKAFAHAYISFIEDSDVAVVFLSQISDGEQFYALSQQATNIKRTLASTGCLAAVKDAISHCPIDLHSASADEVHRSERPARKTLLAPIAPGQLQLLDFVIHAAYFIPSQQQFFSSAIAPHYRSRRKAKMLFRSYGRCRLLLRSAKMPSQICIATDHECFYVSLASEFHIYLAVPRGISTGVIGQFYQWIKSQEAHIFLDHFPVW